LSRSIAVQRSPVFDYSAPALDCVDFLRNAAFECQGSSGTFGQLDNQQRKPGGASMTTPVQLN
jgi:hypothetical protein